MKQFSNGKPVRFQQATDPRNPRQGQAAPTACFTAVLGLLHSRTVALAASWVSKARCKAAFLQLAVLWDAEGHQALVDEERVSDVHSDEGKRGLRACEQGFSRFRAAEFCSL